MLNLTHVSAKAMNDWNKLCKRKVKDPLVLGYKIGRNVQLGRVVCIVDADTYKVRNWDLDYTVTNGEVVAINRNKKGKPFFVNDGLKKHFDKHYKQMFINTVEKASFTLD